MMPENTQPDPNPEDAAVLAGAEVEQPSDASTAAAHTTKTLADVDPENEPQYPLTTDAQAQDEHSVVDPEAS